jgi:hypothetical protein
MDEENETNHHGVWLKAIFGGATSWKEDRRSSMRTVKKSISSKITPEASLIDNVMDESAERHVINFPDQISNFDDCGIRAATCCCWIQDHQANDNNSNCEEPYVKECVDANPMNNMDICLADMTRAPRSSRVAGGFAIFPDDDKGDSHCCHGFVCIESVQRKRILPTCTRGITSLISPCLTTCIISVDRSEMFLVHPSADASSKCQWCPDPTVLKSVWSS